MKAEITRIPVFRRSKNRRQITLNMNISDPARFRHAVRFLRRCFILEREDRKTLNWQLIGLLFTILLALLFTRNLLRMNHVDGPDSRTVQKNIETVQQFHYGTVSSVEKQINALDEKASSSGSGYTTGSRAYYMKLLSGAVIVGDSVTEGFSVYGWLPDGQVYSRIGATLLRDGSLFTQAAQGQPKEAFFSFGLNDIGNFRGDAAAFAGQYEKLLRQFHRASPGTKIFLNSIAPPSPKTLAKRKNLRKYTRFNRAIESLCRKSSYIYVDTTDIFRDHPNFYAGDGIHASTAYYPLWMDEMIRAAGLDE